MKLLEFIPKDLNLGKKLTILMSAIFLGGAMISSLIYYNVLLEKASYQIHKEADMIISIMDSVRKYNNDEITPLLDDKSNQELLLESIPSFGVRRVFEIFSNVYKDRYGEYMYKDAMINPTNLKDKATNEELNIIEELSRERVPDPSQYDQASSSGDNTGTEGYVMVNGNQYFYRARPIKITEPSCLSCHISLEKSPQSLQVLYKQGIYKGNQGFGWELNKVIGSKIIYVPAAKVYNTATRNFILMIGIFIGIFALAIFLVNNWLKQYVVRPLNRITQVAEAVSLGDMESDFEKKSNDEIGRLAEAFSRLKTSLAIAIKRLTKKSHESS